MGGRSAGVLTIGAPRIPALTRRAGGGGDGEQYEGATVIEPMKGFYDTPIATLDFKCVTVPPIQHAERVVCRR